MKLAVWCLVTLAAALFAHARAEEPPASTVRGYFAALEHKDFRGALSMTSGPALDRTRGLIGTLASEAARHHAEVELKVQKLTLAARAPDDGGVTVDVHFDIDVIGKKWFFRRVARKLSGDAQFVVDAHPSRPPHIVDILGKIE
jgi:hypothetical protein